MSDLSMYIYYKGIDDYPNDKAAFFGFYESVFENSYKGKPEDKEEAFKEYMSDLLYEQASEIYHFGPPSVDKPKCFDEYIGEYFNPERNLEKYNKNKSQ